jgi:hypothetical protein
LYRSLKLASKGTVAGRTPLLGRVSTVVDGTGVGRTFTDMNREAGVVFTPVTITGGGNRREARTATGTSGRWCCYRSSPRTSSPSGCASSTRRWAQELIAELNSFEVDFTSAGNMRVDVRSKDHHGGLVIATSLALWSAVGRPSAKIEIGHLENYWHDLRPSEPAAKQRARPPAPSTTSAIPISPAIRRFFRHCLRHPMPLAIAEHINV